MKHKSLTALIVLLVFSLIMTVISAKNYAASLNTVSVMATREGNLRTETTAEGFLHFSSTVTIALPQQCGIRQVLVSPGDEVWKGQPLARFDHDDLALCRLQLLLSKEQLLEQTGASALEQEIAALQIKAIDGQLEALDAWIAAEDTLISPARGQVIGLPSEGGTVELGLYEGEMYCSWEIPKADHQERMTFSCVIGDREETLSVDTVNYNAAKGVYQYRSEPFAVSSPLDTTMPVEVGGVYTSRDYQTILPRRCIRKDSDGSLFVYVVQERETVYGTERYLYKKGITILEQDETHVALMGSLSNVVEYAFRTPVNLEAVRVIEQLG